MSLTVVLDSNIWLNEQMLRHSVGSAVRFFLRRHSAHVVVPEVVRREVELHLEKELKELTSRLREGHRRLLGLVGELKEQVLPTDDELTVIASTAFANAGIEITDFPFSLKSARSSFEKTIRSEPPSGPKNQQFKDGVIWADCLTLAMDSPVLFITQDKAFYKAKDYKKGLADNLIEEAQQATHEISIAHDISSILERIGDPIEIDYSFLHREYYPTISDGTERLIGSEGYELAELLSGDHTVFATNDPNIGHVEFSLQYKCVHPTLSDGSLVAKGECVINSVSGNLSDFRNRGEEFHFVNAEGEQQKRNIVLGVGSIVLGHRTVQHSVRAVLDA
ncbi:PIN domain-containing protein [Stieleria neptunia]|nr:PIN domain-containing protein [Stieleria neptunia]